MDRAHVPFGSGLRRLLPQVLFRSGFTRKLTNSFID
jgi:hypothetical protein